MLELFGCNPLLFSIIPRKNPEGPYSCMTRMCEKFSPTILVEGVRDQNIRWVVPYATKSLRGGYKKTWEEGTYTHTPPPRLILFLSLVGGHFSSSYKWVNFKASIRGRYSSIDVATSSSPMRLPPGFEALCRVPLFHLASRCAPSIETTGLRNPVSCDHVRQTGN